MKNTSRWLSVVAFTIAALTLPASRVWAQSRHVADSATLQQAISQELAAQEADRAVIRHVMARPEAQTVAAKLGLNLTQVDQAINTLDPADLAAAAAPARAADARLAGGDSTIVISVSTLLLLLILVVLIAR